MREVESCGVALWLADAANLPPLGRAIHPKLVSGSTKKGVGLSQANIRHKEASSGHHVRIETQPESTDDVHFGQPLRYATGRDEATIM